jgi:hypothetical protein
MPLFALQRVSGVLIAAFSLSETGKLKSTASSQMTFLFVGQVPEGTSRMYTFVALFFWPWRWEAMGVTSGMVLQPAPYLSARD